MISLIVNNLRKIAPFVTVGLLLLNASSVLATHTPTHTAIPVPRGVGIQLGAPPIGINPGTGLATLITNALTIAFIVAAILVLFFLVIGAFRWITSGGDKEAVAGARKQIVAALVGLAILALAAVIIVVVGQILNIDIFRITRLPSLDSCGVGQALNPTSGACEIITPPPPAP